MSWGAVAAPALGAGACDRPPSSRAAELSTCGPEPESSRPTTPAVPSSTTAVAGTATSAKRRSEMRDRRANGEGRCTGSAAAIARTRSRSVSVATGRVACSAVISSAEVIVPHLLFEFLERPAEPGRHGRRADAEHAGGLVAVELDHDAEDEHLALAGAEGCERQLELGREPFDELGLLRLGLGGGLLAPVAPGLGPEPVERGRAGDPEQPRAGAAAAWVEPRPLAEAPSRTWRRPGRRRAGGRGSGRAGSRRRRRDAARRHRRTWAARWWSASRAGSASLRPRPFYATGWPACHIDLTSN